TTSTTNAKTLSTSADPPSVSVVGRLWSSGWIAAILVTAGAAALRFAHLGAVVGDPFYDGAVRSMGLSWHNFFFGAVEPSGAVAIDKPPVDLWLQVASVKLLGFGPTALKLPEAVAGTLAVTLLFAAVRPVFGTRAGLMSALALAVLPIEVITARSDTMDAVMMAMTVLALLLVVRAALSGRTLWLLLASAVLGVAFDVKLLESIIVLPGLVVFAWLGLPGSRLRRARQLALGAVVYVAVALAWLTGTLLFPAHDRPWAYGSTNGSAWNAAFVFNGIDRLEGKANEGPQVGYEPGRHYPQATQAERDAIPILPPSPTRLLARVGPLSGERLGLEALVGLLLAGAALLAALWKRHRSIPADRTISHIQVGAFSQESPTADPGPTGGHLRNALQAPERVRVALLAGLMLWLLAGAILFSDMNRLHPRYTEGFTPAVAATFGIGLAWASGRASTGERRRERLIALTATLLAIVIYSERLLFGTTLLWWIVAASGVGALLVAWSPHPRLGKAQTVTGALAIVCLLAIPLWASLRSVHENVSDTNRLGVLHSGELKPLSAYLRAHQGSAYYEAAFDSGTKMGELVERDARPILVLTTLEGRLFTSVARLRALAGAGKVRYAVLDQGCGAHSSSSNPDCSAPARWIRAHGVDVSKQAGLPHTGMLWRLPGV
ncbi:MAG: glycosyltransferase family 39 protein, partial [Solirubrobacteraceae bacterium]